MRRAHAVFGFLLAIATRVEGQGLGHRKGLEVGLDVGAGILSLDCPGCRSEVSTGWALQTSLVWSPTERAGLGIQVAGLESRWGGSTARESSIVLVAQYFPLRAIPVMLTGGLGWGKYIDRYVVTPASTERYRTTGGLVQFGLGWERHLSDAITLVPQVQWRRHLSADLVSGAGTLAPDLKTSALQLSVGVRWRFVPASRAATR